MNKIIIGVIFLCFLVICGFLMLHYTHNKKINDIVEDTGVYYGPVQEGYNETLFRNTGRHMPIGEGS